MRRMNRAAGNKGGKAQVTAHDGRHDDAVRTSHHLIPISQILKRPSQSASVSKCRTARPFDKQKSVTCGNTFAYAASTLEASHGGWQIM